MSEPKVLRFLSLLDKRIAYTAHSYSSDMWDKYYPMARTGYVADFAGMFETLGDGMTQHSYEYMAPRERFNDYLGSLTSHLLEHPEDRERMRLNWMSLEIPEKTIAFAFSVKYDEKKTKYYDLQCLKVSSNPDKRFDKRWEEVPKACDGSVEGAYSLLTSRDHYGLLYYFARYEACRAYAISNNLNAGEFGPTFFKLGDRHDHNVQEAHTAWNMLNSLMLAEQYENSARRGFECWKHNCRVEEPAEEVANG